MKIQKPETKASIQLKNIISFIIIVGLTAALCTVLFQHGAHTENLLLIMLVGILTVVIQTKNFLYTIVSSVVLIIFYDYFFRISVRKSPSYQQKLCPYNIYLPSGRSYNECSCHKAAKADR